jgi:pimeloyl-ACP methyl ester carboxylesterase
MNVGPGSQGHGVRVPIRRREFNALAAVGLTALPVPLMAQTGSIPNPPLDIAEWSYSWIGIEHATLARGTMCNGMQMYVEHWFPAEVRRPYPVILIHGGYGQGSDWISTPDGRRGWASLLLEQGYQVYVVDRPGQGRCPYYPLLHGLFDRQAPTFERAASNWKSAQWPGSGDANDPAIAQIVASMGQPMGNNAITQNVWSTRGARLLEKTGPAIFITHGDGCVFAWVTAQEHPELVKGIAAIEPETRTTPRPARLTSIPIALITAENSKSNDSGIAASLRQSGAAVEQIHLGEQGVNGNGPLPMLEKNNREALRPVLDWIGANVATGPTVTASETNPSRNTESTALKLADQGCFWVGIQRKQMTYGTIAFGQMYVQYMIPAQKRYPYPVVMVHGGGGQGTHMMGIGGRPGWVHYFVQAGYSVYWVDRPSYGRSPYHPDALGPSHLPNVPPYEGLIQSTAVFNTAQWPGPGGMNDPIIDQFMACEYGNVSDEAFHSELVWRGGAELLDRLGPSILFVHAFGGFFAWGVADRRPNLVKAILCMEINGNPFVPQLRWGLTASPMTYDPPVNDPSQFSLVDHTEPPDSPRPVPPSYKLQAEPARKWKNLGGIPIGWLTSEFGGGGSPVANVAFLKQVGCDAEMIRLRDYNIFGNGNLMLLEKNNHEVFSVIRDWLDRKAAPPGRA